MEELLLHWKRADRRDSFLQLFKTIGQKVRREPHGQEVYGRAHKEKIKGAAPKNLGPKNPERQPSFINFSSFGQERVVDGRGFFTCLSALSYFALTRIRAEPEFGLAHRILLGETPKCF